LEEFTCDKMRSALQYQVNKMKKADKSTKDAILGKSPINLETYEVVYQKISDHKMVIANLSVWLQR